MLVGGSGQGVTFGDHFLFEARVVVTQLERSVVQNGELSFLVEHLLLERLDDALAVVVAAT